MSHKLGSEVNDILDSYGTDISYPANFQTYFDEYIEEQQDSNKNGNRVDLMMQRAVIGSIRCLPTPGTRLLHV